MFEILLRTASEVPSQTLDGARALLLFAMMNANWAHGFFSMMKATAYAALTAVLMRRMHHPVLVYCVLTAVLLILDAALDMLVLAFAHGGGS
jgi:hypothetical protein